MSRAWRAKAVDTVEEAADGSVASGGIRKVDPCRESPGHDRGRLDFYLRGRNRHAGGDPLHHAGSRARHPHRSRVAVRRSLYGWRHRRRAGLDRRRPRHRARSAPRRRTAGVGAPAMALPLPLSPPADSSIRARGRGATSRITTISTASSTRCSSTPTGNTAAPISRRADQSLDDAQLAKKRHLAAKLLVAPDQRVLDIGCGWGGLALYLAELCGARVTGITLSERAACARTRARRREGTVRQGRLPSAGLSRRAGEIRSHRLGRHVRACRRRLLRRLLPQDAARCSTTTA